MIKKQNFDNNMSRARYVKAERRVTRLEQQLGIRDPKYIPPQSNSDEITEEQLVDLERRMERIQKKCEIL